MKKRNTVSDLKLSKAARNTFIKHFNGKMTATALQEKLGVSATRYYIISTTILLDAIASGQVKPEELLNN